MESEEPHGLRELVVDMSEYEGESPEFISLALLNIFTLFPRLQSLTLSKVNLLKDMGLETLADYVVENANLSTL